MTAETPPQPGTRLPIGGTSIQAKIAEAAIDLFYARGAAATTVRDITSACGLTPGALYNHFASKDQLLYVLVRDVHLRVDEELKVVLAQAGDRPACRLAAAVRLLVAQAADQRKESRVANREYTALATAGRQEVTAIRRRLRDRLTDVLEVGVQNETFTLVGSQDRTAAALTANVIATTCANISEWTRENHPMTLADLQDRYVQMALRLVGFEWPTAPPGPAAPPVVAAPPQ
jgi:TetR/AcrR family transcriptional regulator, cholesterol catabolism regulator